MRFLRYLLEPWDSFCNHVRQGVSKQRPFWQVQLAPSTGLFVNQGVGGLHRQTWIWLHTPCSRPARHSLLTVLLYAAVLPHIKEETPMETEEISAAMATVTTNSTPPQQANILPFSISPSKSHYPIPLILNPFTLTRVPLEILSATFILLEITWE